MVTKAKHCLLFKIIKRRKEVIRPLKKLVEAQYSKALYISLYTLLDLFLFI